MHLLVSSQVLKQLRPILRAGAIIFRRQHCLRRFDIRQGAASFRPPKAQEAPSYRLISGRRKGWRTDVRFGSKADIMLSDGDVRCSPESGHQAAGMQCPLSAIAEFRPRLRPFWIVRRMTYRRILISLFVLILAVYAAALVGWMLRLF